MAIIEFLLWLGVLLYLIRTRAKWWVWVIFIIGKLTLNNFIKKFNLNRDAIEKELDLLGKEY